MFEYFIKREFVFFYSENRYFIYHFVINMFYYNVFKFHNTLGNVYTAFSLENSYSVPNNCDTSLLSNSRPCSASTPPHSIPMW